MMTGKELGRKQEVRAEYALTSLLAEPKSPRSTCYYYRGHNIRCTEKHGDLLALLELIARIRQENGYRRTTPELRDRYGRNMNNQGCGELIPGVESAAAPWHQSTQTERQAITVVDERLKLVTGREKIEPVEVAFTGPADLIYLDCWKSTHLTPLIDAALKLIMAWAVSDWAVTDLAVLLWERPKGTPKAQGVAPRRVTLHHHQDSIFTGYRRT